MRSPMAVNQPMGTLGIVRCVRAEAADESDTKHYRSAIGRTVFAFERYDATPDAKLQVKTAMIEVPVLGDVLPTPDSRLTAAALTRGTDS
jgi:hypothetical protein